MPSASPHSPMKARSRKGVKSKPDRLGSSQRESTIIFILGGARSGKSTFALKKGHTRLAKAFVATGEPFDEEMKLRIRKHQRSRGKSWDTFEVPLELTKWFEKKSHRYDSVVVDCMTLWLNNLLRESSRSPKIISRVKKLLKTIRICSCQTIIVSNELGLGLVPGDPVSRTFRDLAGRLNQLVAAEADEVYFLVSGIPVRVK